MRGQLNNSNKQRLITFIYVAFFFEYYVDHSCATQIYD